MIDCDCDTIPGRIGVGGSASNTLLHRSRFRSAVTHCLKSAKPGFILAVRAMHVQGSGQAKISKGERERGGRGTELRGYKRYGADTSSPRPDPKVPRTHRYHVTGIGRIILIAILAMARTTVSQLNQLAKAA